MRLATLTLALVALPLPAAWLEVRSPHFRLLTDAGERSGRELILALEQLRDAFRGLGGEPRKPPLPVAVYLFASPEQYRRYQPSPLVKGFYQGGADTGYIVLLASGADTRRIAFHEYVHLVLNHTSVRLPQWLEEGLAEFYSTLEVREDRLIVGRPIASHVTLLRRLPWLEAAALASIRRGSPELDEAARAGIFYAQSWALVHMLNFSPHYRERLPRFAGLLAEGEPAGEAFAAAFERTLSQALRDLSAYLAESRWPTAVLPFPTAGASPITVAPIAGRDLDAALLALELELGLWDVSEATLRRLAGSRRPSPEVETARAKLAMSRGDFSAARRHFEAAIAAGSRDASTYFEYAMLLRDAGEDFARVVTFLETAVELNPYHAEAHSLLGRHALMHGRTEEALEHFRRAAEISPRHSSFWHALALAAHKTGRRDLARRAARRAREAALTPQEAEMARAAMDLVEQSAATPPPGLPEVTIPEAWSPPRGDSRVEGILEEIDCRGSTAVLRIRAGDRRVLLKVEDPARVVLRNSPELSFEFACGPQVPRQLHVEYRTAPEPQTSVEGVITAIEFK